MSKALEEYCRNNPEKTFRNVDGQLTEMSNLTARLFDKCGYTYKEIEKLEKKKRELSKLQDEISELEENEYVIKGLKFLEKNQNQNKDENSRKH